MNRSFAQFQRLLLACAIAILAVSCASLPPPTSELAEAQRAVNRADGADASQHSPATLDQARQALTRAQSAMSAGDEDNARTFAVAAAADADLAYAESRARVTQQEYRQRSQEVIELRERLQVADGQAPDALPQIPEANLAPGGEALRLQTLDANQAVAGFAAYERLQARQALTTLLEARKRDLPGAQYVASRRIAVAEIAAFTEQMRREVDRLERDRSDLLVEASRQDAARARQEAERLRIEAQIQAEEAQRLRAEAEAAQQAQMQAEDLIIDVGGSEAEKLKAAREREAELRRREAELMAEDPELGDDGG